VPPQPQRARKPPSSCLDCLAWGVLSGRCCTACYVFRHTYPGQDECAGCGRTIAVRKGYCRLCWNQSRANARATGQPHGTAKAVYFLDTVGAYQQLFFAGMFITRGARTTPPTKHARRGRPPTPPPAPAGRPRHRRNQLRLFDDVRRDFTRFNFNDEHADPDNPWLAWAHYLAYRRGEARGWRPKVHAQVRRALVIVLSGFAEGDTVRYSDLAPAMLTLGIRADRVAEVLDEMGILVDDRRSPFEDWLERKLDGLAGGIGQPVEAWVRALHDGGPRSKARHPDTARGHLNNVRPMLLDWSQRYDHLREVTHDDVLAVVAPLHGSRRSNVLVSLRSLFAFCAKQGAIFRNPTRGIKVGQQGYGVVQPLGQDDVDQAIKVAKTPADRLVLVLAAVHAARPKAIRELLLEDVDLGNRRLAIADRVHPIDEFTHQVLLEWLDYRRTRWPGTANPHLIINQQSAMGIGPVSRFFFAQQALRGQAATLERLRVDRQLEEALARGPDPLHLAAVFGLDPKTAIRYAENARQLLRTAAEEQPRRFPRTQGSESSMQGEDP
jgi:hypothetical protein